jgi:hypothetical protein
MLKILVRVKILTDALASIASDWTRAWYNGRSKAKICCMFVLKLKKMNM